MPPKRTSWWVPPDRLNSVREWARARLQRDPFGSGPFSDTYPTSSLSYDTSQFDVFYRRGSFARSKYRIRRYGSADSVFLERKLKTRDRVGKRRSVIELSDLARLGMPAAQRDWAGHWFHCRVLARSVGPVCRISYERTALGGVHNGEPLRLNLDEQVRALPERNLVVRCAAAGRPWSIGTAFWS